MRLFYLMVLLVWTLGWAQAQTPLQQKMNLDLGNIRLETALNALVIDQNARLVFDKSIIPDVKVKATFYNRPLGEILESLLKGTQLTYSMDGSQIFIERYMPPPPPVMHTLQAYVRNADDGEALVGALIIDSLSGKNTVTNLYGYFTMTLPAGPVKLICSYVGFQDKRTTLVLSQDQKLEIKLEAAPYNIQEIVVVPKLNGVPLPGISHKKIDGKDIQNLPVLLGEPDLIRLLPFMPGVTTGADGVEGLHIRGGSPEQNLVLIDDVPVYNIYHAAGVFSVFNTSAIRSAELIRGAFPARYGGRLSSVLNVRTKEGNDQKMKGEASIGVVAGRFSLEGPIVKNKCAFFISGRQSFLNWYIKPLTSIFKANQGVNGNIDYRFHDLNAKVHYKFSIKDVVYLSFYKGGDLYQDEGKRRDTLVFLGNNNEELPYLADQYNTEGLRWGNSVGALRWNHVFDNRLFANTVLTFSKLDVALNYLNLDSVVNLRSEKTEYRSIALGSFRSNIEDIGAKTDFELTTIKGNTARFGLGLTRRFFKPGILSYDNVISPIDPEQLRNDPIASLENSFYWEKEWRLKSGGYLNMGVHAAGLHVRNRQYWSLQPRFSLSLPLNEFASLRASGGKMTQFLHLLSSAGLGLPSDLWVPATDKIKPQQAWHTGIGADLFFGDLFDLSFDAYYKYMNNLISFTEGAFFLNSWEDNVTDGQGRAYGLEVMIRKQNKRFSGWMSYGLAWSDRQFDKINFGRPFPFKYDRRHDLKLVAAYKVNDWMSLSADWVFSTGFAFSLPLQRYNIDLTDIIFPPVIPEVLDYGSKNQYRMPFNHRLDLGMNMTFSGKKLKHKLQLGVYNAYNRNNPLYYGVRTRFVNENYALKAKKQFVQVWLLPATPSLSYTLAF